MSPVPPDLDHLVYAVPDLAAGIEALELQFGVRPVEGGEHEGLGTHNALVGLGGERYLELIAPLPGAASPSWFDLDELTNPRLIAWAVRRSDLERWRSRSAFPLGRVDSMQRRASDGSLLRWSLTNPDAPSFGGVLPFLIDWDDTPHPGPRLEPGCEVLELHLSHPRPSLVKQALASLELDLEVEQGPPDLLATLQTPHGQLSIGSRKEASGESS